mgnify:FL=1
MSLETEGDKTPYTMSPRHGRDGRRACSSENFRRGSLPLTAPLFNCNRVHRSSLLCPSPATDRKSVV